MWGEDGWRVKIHPEAVIVIRTVMSERTRSGYARRGYPISHLDQLSSRNSASLAATQTDGLEWYLVTVRQRQRDSGLEQGLALGPHALA